MSGDYVAGSLSALFGKSSKKSANSPVQLKHVKQLYEEFSPLKAPRELGDRHETPKKRKSTDDKPVINGKEKKIKVEKAGVKPEAVPGAVDDTVDFKTAKATDLTNRQAALKRIEQKTKSTQKKEKQEQNSEAEEKRNFRYYEDDPAYIPQTIFVKNLPPKAQRKHMKKLFAKCGEILFVRFANAVPAKAGIPVEAAIKKRSLIKEGTTISAFVVFKDISSVQTALELNGIEYEGHHLRVDRREASNIPPKRSVFCGNIPFDTTDDELWQFFGEAGEIDYVRVVRDNTSGNGKGIAFVVFKKASAAVLALELTSKEFKGRTIRVSAVERRKTTLPPSKNAQMSASKEKINKKKMEKKSLKHEIKIKGAPRMNKQLKEKVKKSIKRGKLQRIKKKIAKKLQGVDS